MISSPRHQELHPPSTVELGILTMHLAVSDDALSVILEGDLDLSGGDELTRIVRHELAVRRPGQLVMDLAALTFMDSSGVRTLLELQRSAGERCCDFRLLHPQRSVRRVLEVTHLLEQFRIEP